jgi:acyl carrier protein
MSDSVSSTGASATEERLRRILVEHYRIDPARLTPEASLEALGLDSLGMTELLFYIEDEFQLKLPSDVAPLPTLGAAVQYVDGLLATRTSP